MARKWTLDVLAIIVVAVWACSCIADMVIDGYDPPPAIHGIMLAVATAAFGGERLRRAVEKDK